MRKKKTGVISTIFLILILLVGLSVMLYPTISDWWNSKVQPRAIASYSQAVEDAAGHRQGYRGRLGAAARTLGALVQLLLDQRLYGRSVQS